LACLAVGPSARADEPPATPAATPAPACAHHAPDCLGHWAPIVIRLHAGLGVFLNGGAVTTGAVPNLVEHARFSAQLAGEVGARPFGGGTLLSLLVAGQAADGALVGTFGLSLEYDVLYLFDSDPDRDFALALGGALTMDYAHSTTTSASGVTWSYDLLRPDWRAYVELRIRSSARERWLIRAQIVTGFDDFLDLASATLCGGYVFEAL
jgi:hypothetical protein